MKPHKWHKEICAWANGAEIEVRFNKWDGWSDWELQKGGFVWFEKEAEYRIKPQPKEPQYLYAHRTNEGDITFEIDEGVSVVGYQYIGKIKLEVDDE